MITMAYKVLYRKYRPKTFKEIIGQNVIIDNLKRCVKNVSFSHAYIFTGPRGTGKTSTAKVLAKAINCTNSVEGEACGECDNCKNFSTTPDIIEIDAASNNGVDEIRELRSNITLAPAASKYKVYIIDEVHMLSPGAFNALLKTLEEPPNHAIFILATTEVYKVPITILSRCQRYDFKKVSKDELVSHLEDVCQKEQIDYDKDALYEIYSLSEGCLRDALSILDQIAKSEKKLTLESVLTSYNIVSNETIKGLLKCALSGDVEGVITFLENLEDSSMNAQKLLKKMINYLEKKAIDIKLGKEREMDFKTIKNLIENLNKCYIDARINENVFTIIKLCFLELINIPKEVPKSDQKSQLKAEKIREESKEVEFSTQSNVEVTSIKQIRVNNCFVGVNKESLKELTTIWEEIDSKKLSSIDPKDYMPVASSNEYTIFTTDESSLAHLFNMKCEEIEKIIKKKKKNIKVVALTVEEWAQEREKFKDNLKHKREYKLIEEPQKSDESKKIKEKMNDLFSEKIVEIS